MILENVKEKYIKEVENILKQIGFNIYEINITNEHESKVFQVLVENIDQSKKNIDFDDLVKANEQISSLLDNVEELKDPYILEVSSAGAERKVKAKEVLDANIGSYFNLKVKEPIETIKVFDATLKEKNDDKYLFTFFIKGKPKKVKLLWEEIEQIRFAVKF